MLKKFLLGVSVGLTLVIVFIQGFCEYQPDLPPPEPPDPTLH